ncbi:miniconductance mechanosensitive channel MscM precursor [mine drainage metagenome]|uniref:Miniconductance mechanosensitive channel MscM n=1 Tax=mine drainage metagenome TaxID=410659 RepID=A0A1J5R736_9ZZZZ
MRTELIARIVQADQAVHDVTNVVKLVVAVVVGIVLALALAEVASAVVRAAGRRTWLAVTLAARARRPLRAVLLVVAVWLGLRIGTTPTPPPSGTGLRAGWVVAIEHGLQIALIFALAWLVGALAFVVEDAALRRYSMDMADNRHARRIRTQVTVLRRVTVAALVLCAIAGALLTFPSARTAGASVLASAGLISLVAGLAAQSVLGNFFAGVQLAFSDAIRIGDVVVVDGEWGRIEEITMTYVVVHVWDDRRLILPSTRFTSKSFENWTRRSSQLLGAIELDLDWNVPVEAMRAELRRLLDTTDLWDGRVGVLQVTDASNGAVRIRALASAADAPSLFDLRCYVREGLVRWLQREMPSALPRTRWEGAVAGAVPVAASVPDERPADAPVIEVPGAEVAFSTVSPPVPVRASADDVPSRGPATILLTTAVPPEPVPPEPASSGPIGSAPTSSGPIGSAPTMVVPMSDGEPATVSRRSVRRSGEPEESRQSGQQETIRLDLSASDSRLFTGSIDAIERSKAFTGPGEGAYAERDEAVEKAARAERAEQEAAERHGAVDAKGAANTEGKEPTPGGPDR